MKLSTLTADDVAHLKPGDYVEAEFEELTHSCGTHSCGTHDPSQPTGHTYVLRGELGEYDGILWPDRKGLSMPNSMCVRQIDGNPGTWLVRIVTHQQGGSE